VKLYKVSGLSEEYSLNVVLPETVSVKVKTISCYQKDIEYTLCISLGDSHSYI